MDINVQYSAGPIVSYGGKTSAGEPLIQSPVTEAHATIDKDIATIVEHFEALAARLVYASRPGGPSQTLGAADNLDNRSALVANLDMTHERLLALLNRIDDVASRLEL